MIVTETIRRQEINVVELCHEVRKQAFPRTFGWSFSRRIHIGGLCPKHVETRRGHHTVYPRSA